MKSGLNKYLQFRIVYRNGNVKKKKQNNNNNSIALCSSKNNILRTALCIVCTSNVRMNPTAAAAAAVLDRTIITATFVLSFCRFVTVHMHTGLIILLRLYYWFVGQKN